MLPPVWPPAYVQLPPLYLGAFPGWTFTAWVLVGSSGPLLTLGTKSGSSARAPFLKLSVDPSSLTVAWAGTTLQCAHAPYSGWMFVALSFAPVLNGGMRFVMAHNQHACSNPVGIDALPAQWWTNVVVGGESFSGAIGSLAIYDDTALTAVQLASMATGTAGGPSCGTRPPQWPGWTSTGAA